MLAVTPSVGYLIAVHKDSVKYNNDDQTFKQTQLANGLGTAYVERVYPGSVPFYGHQHHASTGQLDILSADTNMKYAVILSGMHYLSDCVSSRPGSSGVNPAAMTNIIEATKRKAREYEDIERFGAFGDSASIDLEKATVDEVKQLASKMFGYFSTIEPEDEGDYLLYVIGRKSMFVQSILQKLCKVNEDCLCVALEDPANPKMGPTYTTRATNPHLVKNTASDTMLFKPLFIVSDADNKVNNRVDTLMTKLEKINAKKPNVTITEYIKSLELLAGREYTLVKVDFEAASDLIMSLCSISISQCVKLSEDYKENGYAGGLCYNEALKMTTVTEPDSSGYNDSDCTRANMMAVIASSQINHTDIDTLRLFDQNASSLMGSRSPYGKSSITVSEMNKVKGVTKNAGLFTVAALFDGSSPFHTEYVTVKDVKSKDKPGVPPSKIFKVVKAVTNACRDEYEFNFWEANMAKSGMNIPMFMLDVFNPVNEYVEQLLTAAEEEETTAPVCDICLVPMFDLKERNVCPCTLSGAVMCLINKDPIQSKFTLRNFRRYSATHFEGDSSYTSNIYGKTTVSHVTDDNWVDKYNKFNAQSADKPTAVGLDELLASIKTEPVFGSEFSDVTQTVNSQVSKYVNESEHELVPSKLVEHVITRFATPPAHSGEYIKRDKRVSKKEDFNAMSYMIDKDPEKCVTFCKRAIPPFVFDKAFSPDTLAPTMARLFEAVILYVLTQVERKMVNVLAETARQADLDNGDVLQINNDTKMVRTYGYSLNHNVAPNMIIKKELQASEIVLLSHVAANGYQDSLKKLEFSKVGVTNIITQHAAGVGSAQPIINGFLHVPQVSATATAGLFEYSTVESSIPGQTTINSPVTTMGKCAIFKQTTGDPVVQTVFGDAGSEMEEVVETRQETYGDTNTVNTAVYVPNTFKELDPTKISKSLRRTNLKVELIGQESFLDPNYMVTCAENNAKHIAERGHRTNQNTISINPPLVETIGKLIVNVCASVVKAIHTVCSEDQAINDPSILNGLKSVVGVISKGAVMRKLLKQVFMDNPRLSGSLNVLLVASEVYLPQTNATVNENNLAEELGFMITRVCALAALRANVPVNVRDHKSVVFGIPQGKNNMFATTRTNISPCVLRLCTVLKTNCQQGSN